MAQENNFLIGYGERLTTSVEVPSGGSPKNLPYEFRAALTRLSGNIKATAQYLHSLPSETCPQNETMAIVTMHPRFVSKSDRPTDFLTMAGLRVVGSRQRPIRPDRWGVQEHPETAQTDDLFVAGRRDVFYKLSDSLNRLSPTERGAGSIQKIESISAFDAEQKMRAIPDSQIVLLEVLLHNLDNEDIITSFIKYIESKNATAIPKRRRDLGALTFIPVEVSRGNVIDIARYSFVRVCRGMPNPMAAELAKLADMCYSESRKVAMPLAGHTSY